MKNPIVAQFCTAFAWIALIFAPIQFGVGVFDSMPGGSGRGAGEVYSAMFALFSSLVFFALSRVIVLLAEIAANGQC